MIEIVIGTGILMFLLLYFSFNLEKKHFLFKLFIAFFVFFTLINLPLTMTTTQVCTNEVINETVSGNLTTYDYNLICNNTTNEDGVKVYKNYLFFVSIFSIYILVYFIYEMLEFTGRTIKIKQNISNMKMKYRRR